MVRLLARCSQLAAALALGLSVGDCWALEEFDPRINDFDPRTGTPTESIAKALPNNGDPSGIRKWLAERGVFYSEIYTNDVLANVQGGLRRGTIDQGKLESILAVDLGKLAGLQGLSFFANTFLIHNTGRIRRDYVGGINTIAAIEAVPTGRLSELWLEQKFLGGAASVRFGQLAADAEFFFSDLSAATFLQSDWPTITASNLPSGGPAYPLSTPGVRLKVDPAKDVSLLLAVFNGDPAGAGPGGTDAEIRNHYGLNFRVNDPAFIIGEAQFRTNQAKADTGLARTLKFGAWGHLGEFHDHRFANDGTLLADPAGSGVPAGRRGNWGVYGIIDQQLYRPKGGDALSGISVFSRVSVSPSDRNPIDFYVDGGIVFAGMIPGRPFDRFGASFIYSRFSDSLRAFDQDQIAFSGVPGVVRDYEANLELTYVAQIIPGWTVQPVVTRVWHPSGGESPNATVMGVRSIWRY
jgi:porin